MGLYFWDGNEHIPEVKVMVDLQKGEYFFGGGGDDGGGDDDDGGDDGGGGGQSRAGLLKGFLPLKEVSTRSSLHHHCFSSTLRLNHFVFCESFKGNLSSTCIITQSPLWEYLSNLSQFFHSCQKRSINFFHSRCSYFNGSGGEGG